MQVKEPTFSVSNMFTFNSQQYFKYFDFLMPFLITAYTIENMRYLKSSAIFDTLPNYLCIKKAD